MADRGVRWSGQRELLGATVISLVCDKYSKNNLINTAHQCFCVVLYSDSSESNSTHSSGVQRQMSLLKGPRARWFNSRCRKVTVFMFRKISVFISVASLFLRQFTIEIYQKNIKTFISRKLKELARVCLDEILSAAMHQVAQLLLRVLISRVLGSVSFLPHADNSYYFQND